MPLQFLVASGHVRCSRSLLKLPWAQSINPGLMHLLPSFQGSLDIMQTFQDVSQYFFGTHCVDTRLLLLLLRLFDEPARK
jgi:hypothetical protein